MKKLLIIALLIIIVFNTSIYATYESEALVLNKLGLFLGSDKGFELYRKPNRLEGAVMLLRLLGKEDEALFFDYTHPFTDVPQWADPYVGYMYEKGLTKGIGSNLFGSELDLEEEQYMTFVLRALGYDDSQGDFFWEDSMTFALLKNIVTLNQKIVIESGDFLRDHMVLISYEALKSKLNDFDDTLITKLYNEGNVLYKDIMSTNEIKDYFESDKLLVNDLKYYTNNINELIFNLEVLMINFETIGEISIKYYDDYDNFANDFSTAFNAALDIVKQKSGFYTYAKEISYSRVGDIVTFTIGYFAIEELVERSQELAYTLMYDNIKKEMNDFEKILTFHDIIIENTRYDIENYENNTVPKESFNMCGVMMYGVAVCQGYAETFNYLMGLVGIESVMVIGVAGVDHAWNLVKLDGEYYHIDLTHDDPVSDEDVLSYKYFLVTDEYIEKNRTWDRDAYPKANGTKYNYFNYYDLVAKTKNDLRRILEDNINASRDTMLVYENIPDDDIKDEIKDIMFNELNISTYNVSHDPLFDFIRISDVIYE